LMVFNGAIDHIIQNNSEGETESKRPKPARRASANIGMTSAGRDVPNKELYRGSPRVLRNFAVGSDTYLASPTEPSRVVMEHFRPLLRVPSVGGFRIVLEENMAPRPLSK